MRFTENGFAILFTTLVENVSSHPLIAGVLLFLFAGAAVPFGRLAYRHYAAKTRMAEIITAKAQFELTEKRSAKRARDAAARAAKGPSTKTRALPAPKQGQLKAIAASNPQDLGPDVKPEETPAE